MHLNVWAASVKMHDQNMIFAAIAIFTERLLSSCHDKLRHVASRPAYLNILSMWLLGSQRRFSFLTLCLRD